MCYNVDYSKELIEEITEFGIILEHSNNEKHAILDILDIDLSELFDEINAVHFDGKITKIPVHWNTRLRTTAGRCKAAVAEMMKIAEDGSSISEGYCHIPIEIDLNKRLFEYNGYDRAMIYKTLAHEMTHAYLIEHYNEKGHTARFHDIMTKITGIRKNHRCHDYDVPGSKDVER